MLVTYVQLVRKKKSMWAGFGSKSVTSPVGDVHEARQSE